MKPPLKLRGLPHRAAARFAMTGFFYTLKPPVGFPTGGYYEFLME